MGTESHYFICDVANREEVYKQAKVVREKVIMNNQAFYFQIIHSRCGIHVNNECFHKYLKKKKC